MRRYIRSIRTFAAAAGLLVPLAGCATSNAGQGLRPATSAILETAQAMSAEAHQPIYGQILDVTPNEEVAGELIRAFESYRWDEDARDPLVVRNETIRDSVIKGGAL
jgi:hypothetical protein